MMHREDFDKETRQKGAKSQVSLINYSVKEHSEQMC